MEKEKGRKETESEGEAGIRAGKRERKKMRVIYKQDKY